MKADEKKCMNDKSSTYLIFADNQILNRVELHEGDVEIGTMCDGTSGPIYDNATWQELYSDIGVLLDKYIDTEEPVAEILEKTAKKFGTDIMFLYAVIIEYCPGFYTAE